MSTQKPLKINQLMTTQPSGVVFLASWLAENGYSRELQMSYRESGWLKSIGVGAMIKAGDSIDYTGAVYALQKQRDLSIHPGGKTALSLLGKMHYLELMPKEIVLFGIEKENLPSWFIKYDWDAEISFHKSSFLPSSSIGYTTLERGTYNINISNAERAILECLYLCDTESEIIEAYELLEGLNNLMPGRLQTLLEQCSSIKVKRLFLYLAEKINHNWFSYINVKNIDLGKGNRSLVNKGVYNAKYAITVPKELSNV